MEAHLFLFQEVFLHLVAMNGGVFPLELTDWSVGKAALTNLFHHATLLNALVEAVHEAGCRLSISFFNVKHFYN